MGRNKGRVIYFQPKRPPKKKAQADPDQQLAAMEPFQLVQGINNLLRALEKKGVQIADYDHREKKLYSVQQVKGKFYYLAEEPEPEETTEGGDLSHGTETTAAEEEGQ